ncbi:MAG: hypothetical protein ACT4QD_19185 [Acidobacteriota bacterium]
MTKPLHTIMFAVALAMALGVSGLRAQAEPQPQDHLPPPGAKSPIPLQVQVVISKYQGEKKMASLPYTLAVNATRPGPGVPTRPAQLKMGSSVPIMAPPVTSDKPAGEPATGGATANRGYTYQYFGTQIDCSAVPAADGRFELSISIEDSSIYVDDQAVKGVSKGNDPPILRSFRSRNDLILRDGQSTQFTAATDRITGEVIRIDVTLNVLK